MWNNQRALLLLFAVIWGGISTVYGASTLFVTSSGAGIDVLTDLSGGNLDRTLVILEIDSAISQSPAGFRLEISSLNSGRLVRKLGLSTYANDALSGNVADYTFSLVSGSGTLGTDAPSLPTDHPLSTSIVLEFSQNVVANTVDKQYACLFTVPSKAGLFQGTFGDLLTFTLTDL